MLFAQLIVCVGPAAESAPLAQGLLQKQAIIIFAAKTDPILVAVAEEQVLHGAPEDREIKLGLIFPDNLALNLLNMILTFS